MRILISSSSYAAANGQAVFTVNLAEGLAKRGHEVVVLVRFRSRTNIPEEGEWGQDRIFEINRGQYLSFECIRFTLP